MKPHWMTTYYFMAKNKTFHKIDKNKKNSTTKKSIKYNNKLTCQKPEKKMIQNSPKPSKYYISNSTSEVYLFVVDEVITDISLQQL